MNYAENSLFEHQGVQYRIKRLLGKGKSAYSYLIEHETNEFVLKQIHDEPCPYYNFDDKFEHELSSYEKLLDLDIRMPELRGQSKERDYLIKEFVDGTLASWNIAMNKLDDNIVEQLFEMSASARRHGYNLDYFPGNFIIKKNYLYYIDYEINSYSYEWSLEKWGLYYWANSDGMREFMETGDYLKINEKEFSGIPVKKPFESKVQEWISQYSLK